ncbi:hypothetical protein HYPGJ_31010 [Hyphomicrobium sp. GJ21]|uniref:hypothetical protein n=1 Tax=Hyphomicrobium sp. GJ21 TaxID=113574 RepID=UPI000622C24B|nr:hypothetical protein [Hyphomicrobium sp. GJ21]CEJ87239.1 hypothetical protein HYPGJ_31010 [Hyphomicrobium sp. GJ21]
MAKVDAPVMPTAKTLTSSIEACITNGERLIDDAMWLECQEPPASKLVLAMLAQEEYAKAFLLFLVREDVIRWSPYLLRAMNDHICKQLVGTVIEYINPLEDESEEEMVKRIREEVMCGLGIPLAVADAISILRHEKIGRWVSNNWQWSEPPDYAAPALHIAEGKRDRLKQDALYVRIGRDGRAVSTPTSANPMASDEEFERAWSYRHLMSTLLRKGGHSSSRYQNALEFIRKLFAHYPEAHVMRN